MIQLGRLLLSGYGLAALAAVATAQAAGGVVLPVAVFWLGGALAVCVLAVMPGTGRLFRREIPTEQDEADHDAALARALEAWEQDRLADRAMPDDRREQA